MSTTLLRLEAEVVPRTLVFDPPLSDGELERLCQRNDVVRIERTSEGVIRVDPLTGALTSDANSEIVCQLGNWWHTHQQGRMLGAGVGFFLADGSLLSPDAAYVLPEQLQGLTKADLARMPHLCPAFVVELLSPSESLAETQRKMECWIANGAQLAWLVDPYRQCVEVSQPGSASFSTSMPRLQGVGPVAGFELDLARIWRCYEV